ncbi:MAG: redoxin family protein, partial [Planctomycetes bacterium]|nr:redoxin family protein [Planctomycetota bacterium]
MGNRLLSWVMIGALAATSAWAVDVGEPVGELRASDEQGQAHALSSHKGKTVVFVFWGSRCPSSQAYAERLKELAQRSGVVFYGVASNSDENPDSVKGAKAKQQLPFPILLDPSKALAKQLGAGVTPTACVVDGQGVLRYRGAIDDDPGGNRDNAERYLERAIAAVKAGQTPDPASTR